mgnify:CR=1 FL=1
MVSAEGGDNFHTRHASSVAASIGRTLADHAAVYMTPIWVHNSAIFSSETRNTFVLGVGGRVRVRPTVYVVGEVAPRLAGYAPNRPEFAFAVEKRAGGHMFQLNVGNASGTTTGLASAATAISAPASSERPQIGRAHV